MLPVKKAFSRSLAIHISRDTGTEQKEEVGSELAYSIFEIKMATEPQLTPGQAKPTDQYFFKT